MYTSNRALAAIAVGIALGSPVSVAQSASATSTNTPAVTSADESATASASSAAASASSTTATDMATSASASTSASDNAGTGNWWAEADRNGDGKLSVAESTANASIGTRFTTIDSNGDGLVTRDEYRLYFAANTSQSLGKTSTHSAVVTRDLWLALDTDSDSRISIAEAAGDTALSSEFSVIDANSDGFVVQGEYTLYAQARR